MSSIVAPAVPDLAARAEAVRKVFGEGPNRVEALRGVDLQLPRDQYTAIMGPSGSGKSTLMHSWRDSMPSTVAGCGSTAGTCPR